jgi:Protein of unknown function (DUF1236)
MKNRMAVTMALGTIMLGGYVGMPLAQTWAQTGGTQTDNASEDTGISGAIEQKLLLTPAQRTAIYQEVNKDKSKTAPKEFSLVVGADVPPMIELYALPDDAVSDVPAAKLYKYTMVQDKVVVVDPTRMRVIDVIGPPTKQ